jgi:ankyrin repeat protein
LGYRRGSNDIAALLVALGGVNVIEAKDKDGHTSVEYIAGNGNRECFKIVLNTNPDIGYTSR